MFLQFIVPVLRTLSGDLNPFRALSTAVAVDNFKKSAGRLHFARGISYFDDGWYVRSAGEQDSHILTSFANANCFVFVPADREVIKGDRVFIQNFDGPLVDLKTFRQEIAGLLK